MSIRETIEDILVILFHKEPKIIMPKEPEYECDHETHYAYGCKWFCIRCGGQLVEVAKNNEHWGDWCHSAMCKDGTEWFLCSNDNCCHHDAPLILHHPIGGYRRAAGR
jgi:hypothetical protein